MKELLKNDVCTVTVEGYASDGAGVARADGRVVFVKGGLKDETCSVKILKVTKNVAYAKVEEVIEPSEHRVSPVCPVFGKCGGCDLLHMDYDEELRMKKQRADDALIRLGGLSNGTSEIWGADGRWEYRNKVIFAITKKDGRAAAGFYREHSHDVVPVQMCPVQAGCSNRAAFAVCRWMDICRVPAYDEKTGGGDVRHIFCRYGFATGEFQVVVVSAKDRLKHTDILVEEILKNCPETKSIVHNVNKTLGNTVLGGEFHTIWGADAIEDELCSLRFKLSPRSFYQINRLQAEKLYGRALAFAALTGEETVLDLYCGTGTITLCLARGAKRVIGAEIVEAAIDDARENARRNGITNAEFFCADASEIARKLRGEGFKPDVVVVDPPRKGLAPDVPEIIAGMAPKRVVYVSCDPATLSRDIKIFSGLGYEATRCEAVDMFPGTSHTETVVLLSRKTPDDQIVVDLNLDELDATSAETKATYPEIKEFVLKECGLKVSSLYISQIKRKCGLGVGDSYNLPKSENARVPQCPQDKENAIRAALKHFAMT